MWLKNSLNSYRNIRQYCLCKKIGCDYILNGTHNQWTKEEIQIIKDNYTTYNDEELVKLIPRHSLSSIATKRKRMGLDRKELNKKYRFEDFKALAESKGYIVTSLKEDYHNAGSTMRYLCPVHGEQTTTMGRLLEGKGCMLCGRSKAGVKRRRDIDEEYNKKVCDDFDYTYVSSYKSRDNLGRIVILIDFICNKHKEYGVQSTRQNNLRKGSSACVYCHHKNLPRDYLLNEMCKNAPHIEILDDNFSKVNDKIRCRCKIHNIEGIKRVGDIIKGKGCIYCGFDKLAKSSMLTKEEVIDRLKTINPNLEMIDEYNGTQFHNTFKCKKCGHIWISNICTVNFCPHCEKFYKGEKAIEEILLNMNVNFETQKRFVDCKDKRPLPFDFYLPNHNVCIEYQGKQHYYALDYFGGEEAFNIRCLHDNIKREYCKKNTIKLIEIPYWYDTKEKISIFLKKEI